MRGNWEVKKLDELCDIARGGSPRPIKEFLTDEPEGVNWIKISDATASSKYIYETKQKIKPEGIRRSRLVHDGDFLLSNSMSFGRPYIMRTSGCIHDGWLVLGNISESLNHDYLYYFLGSPEAYQQFDDRASGSTVRNLNIDLVRSVQILVPPIEDQKRIVAILDEAFAGIDTAIANTEKNLANARELFESYLNLVFTQRGDGWEDKELEEITSKLGDGLHGTPKYTPDGEYHFINGNNLNDGVIEFKERTKKVSFEEFEKYKKELNERTVLVSINGTLGNVAFYNNEKVILGKSACYFNLIDGVEKAFVKYVIQSPYFLSYAHREATGATIKNVSLKSMRKFKVPLPSVEKQKELVVLLDGLSAETRRLESIYQQKLNSLNELKQSLLQKAFSGELTAKPDILIDGNYSHPLSFPRSGVGMKTETL
ncbi:restriction endonuclease subunit S [Methylotuvimicrobium sp. KM2]|uniref:restriction endonuclease subunit S n=1 Tax=Methylotuvimicrobium sp. KM2 TaxID=3133976 RepID=UPI003100C356